jgi:hypothetical protein
MHGHPEIGRPCPRHMRAELGLLGFEGFCVTGYSVVHTRRTGGLHSVHSRPEQAPVDHA